MTTTSACNVCQTASTEVFYRSKRSASLTSMCQVVGSPTEVSYCDHCGHLQTQEIMDIDDYYARQYAILAESPEEDQLYRVVDGKTVFQVEHRVRTLQRLVPVPAGAQVLDFGCAKGSVLTGLREQRPDVTPYFFDVTQRYLPFWREFADPQQWATGTVPQDWEGKFDLVCSFYVLEHVADPVAIVTQMRSLLKPGGVLYFLVPNVLANSADLVVADHLQHYSESSLCELLARSGLETLLIDGRSHDAAYVVAARRPDDLQLGTGPMVEPRTRPAELREKYQAMSGFWSDLATRIEAFEQRHRGRGDVCIYGAGFYGNFIASCLHHPHAVSCFVDQNPYLQGRSVQGKPVVAPAELASEVSLMYVGLNPTVARSVIGGIGCWSDRRFDIFYL